jgi:hypothetical protein
MTPVRASGDEPIRNDPRNQTTVMSVSRPRRVLAPMERISEVLFGLIMVLTYTSTLSIAAGGHADVRTMLLGALGCNVAWGIIDAAFFLLQRLSDHGEAKLTLQAVHGAADRDAAHRVIAGALPPVLASVLPTDQLEVMRQKLQQVPLPSGPRRLSRDDWRGAIGIFLLVFLSTFPVAIPFLLIEDAKLALRVSNAVAIAMLFLCGYAFGKVTGLHRWAAGLSMVAIGGGLTGVAIALGG